MRSLKVRRTFPIEEIAFNVEDLFLNEPLRIANENYKSSKTVFVSIKTKGFEGIGEAAPDKEVTNEDFRSVSSFLWKAKSKLKDVDSLDIQRINREMDEISKGNNSAKAGIDIALYDLVGKISKRNVVSLLGGKRKQQTNLRDNRHRK